MQDSKSPREPCNIIGDVVVKNLFLHAVDICVLKAIEMTGLVLMTDCIVFSQKGHR